MLITAAVDYGQGLKRLRDAILVACMYCSVFDGCTNDDPYMVMKQRLTGAVHVTYTTTGVRYLFAL